MVEEYITEVEVSASRKKQFERYEPAESFVSLTADVPEGEDVQEFTEALQSRASELAREDIFRRFEDYEDRRVEE
jgi:hypothetical protein